MSMWLCFVVLIGAHLTLINAHHSLLQPLLPGEKRQKEEWENPFVYGMGLNFILILLIAFFKPDTRYMTVCDMLTVYTWLAAYWTYIAPSDLVPMKY